NERDELVETATGNLFLVRDGVLVTPDLASGPLPGVTREAVLELARALGLPAEERPVPAQELDAAEEAFVTSSVAEVAPVTAVDGRPLAAGPLTGRLAAAYRELVRRETGANL
ncbi:MAG TPA: aminotransferase class IV, partial [Dehalococcoidia bacterium]